MLLLHIYKKEGIYLFLPTRNMTTYDYSYAHIVLTIFSNQSEIQISLFCFLVYFYFLYIYLIFYFVHWWWSEKTDFCFARDKYFSNRYTKVKRADIGHRRHSWWLLHIIIRTFLTNTVYLVCVVHKLLIILWNFLWINKYCIVCRTISHLQKALCSGCIAFNPFSVSIWGLFRTARRLR